MCKRHDYCLRIYTRLCVICCACFLPLILSGFSDPPLIEIESAVIQKEYGNAQKLAESFIAQDPVKEQKDRAQYFLALSQLGQQQFNQARDDFNQLIAGSPERQLRDKAYLGLYYSYYLEARYSDALNTIEELHKLSPDSDFQSLIYLNLGKSHLRMAHWQLARSYLKKIVDGYPDSLEFHLAKQLLEEKQYFAVQVGSFLDRSRAEKLISELRDQGDYAYIIETVDQYNRKFYRVRVGQMTLLNDARELQTRLSQRGYPTQIYP